MIGDFVEFIHLGASTAASRMAQVELTIMTKLTGSVGAGAKPVTISTMLLLVFNNVTLYIWKCRNETRYLAHLTDVFLEYRLNLRTPSISLENLFKDKSSSMSSATMGLMAPTGM